MKIEYVDEHNLCIVKMDRTELGIITLTRFGDKYGNNGERFSKDLIGKEYDLLQLSEKLFDLKVMIECKNQILQKLDQIKQKTTEMTWSFEEKKENLK